MKELGRARRARMLTLAAMLALSCAVGPAIAGDVEIFSDGFEPPPPTLGDVEAARFLDQATFGGRLSDIAHVRSIGYDAWLQEQFAAPMSLQKPYLIWVRDQQQGGVYQEARLEAWFIHAAQLPDPSNTTHTHSDQLRQRVAFALSEMMVVSDINPALQYQPFAVGDYYDTLARNAFGNFRQLLEDVTLHPAMGRYLSMLGNRKPDAQLNIRPDENYAREVLQLFSIGLHRLALDGSRIDGDPALPGVQPIPTYDQNVVRGFAHVFTGWNYAGCTAQSYGNCEPQGDAAGWTSSMQPVEAFHDTTTPKQLLQYPGVALPGGLLAPGGNARQNLAAALDNVFHHPNVGPFLARHLIQRLVTSNPSPGYIQRVATVFNDNGQGVRGDLRAVVRAILLDVEARNGHLAAPSTFGKLREPITRLVRLWRVAPGSSANGRVFEYSHPESEFGQLPLGAPSVFNFFRPDFAQPGEIRDAGLVSPEFQIHTDTQLVTSPNYLGWRIFYFWGGSNYAYAQADEETLMDYSTLRTLSANPGALVDHLNLVMMSGGMSSFMRDLLIARLNGPLPDVLPGLSGGTQEQRRSLFRVQQALYLIVTSPEFSVQK